jgi:hypothetical protein
MWIEKNRYNEIVKTNRLLLILNVILIIILCIICIFSIFSNKDEGTAISSVPEAFLFPAENSITPLSFTPEEDLMEEIKRVESEAIARHLNNDSKVNTVGRLANDLIIKVDEATARLKLLEQIMIAEGMPVFVDTEDLTRPSHASVQELNLLLNDTPMDGLGWEFLKAENDYGVNAIFHIAVYKQESSLGESNAAITRNNGAGIMSNDGLKTFDSMGECIAYSGRLLGEDYLTENGKYFNGKSISDVNVRYCVSPDGSADIQWGEKIMLHVNNFIKTIQ